MKASILNKLFCTLVTWLHEGKLHGRNNTRETFSKRDCSTSLTVIFRAQNPTAEEEEVSNGIFNSSKKKKLPYYKQPVMCHVQTPQCLVHPHRSKLFRSVSSCRNKDEKVSSKVFLLRQKLLLVTIIYLHISLLQVQLNCMKDIDLLQSKTQRKYLINLLGDDYPL